MGLDGKYTYNDLKSTLHNNGVETMYMAAVLRKIAADNNIDNIKELDGKETIKISDSVFNSVQQEGVNSSVEAAEREALLPYTGDDINALAMGKIAGDGDNVMDLPEIYNDDEYEVVEYEDFYNFNAEEADEDKDSPDKEDQTTGEELDFEAFEAKYGNVYSNTITDEKQQEEALKKIFGMLDTNSNEHLDKAELSGAFYSSMLNQEKSKEGSEDIAQEDGNLLGGDMMDMDMSNDSFNPQG